MEVTMQQMDRRVRRSEKPSEAARLFLEHVVTHSGCKAIAIATEHGLLLSGAGEGVDLDWLAAIASIGTEAPRFVRESAGEHVAVSTLEIGGHSVHVASLGEPRDRKACEAGIARICAPLFAWAA